MSRLDCMLKHWVATTKEKRPLRQATEGNLRQRLLSSSRIVDDENDMSDGKDGMCKTICNITEIVTCASGLDFAASKCLYPPLRDRIDICRRS